MNIKTIVTTRYVGEDGFEFTFEPVEDTITVEKTPKGYTARYLVQDDNPISPDENGDSGLFLVNYHRDFDVRRDSIIVKQNVADYYGGEKIPQEDKYHIFNLSMFSHSGIILSLSRTFISDSGGWDTSHVGLVLVSKKEWHKRDNACEAAESLVNEWNAVLSGDVYGCVVEYYNKNKKQLNQESCWGYIGFEAAKEELKGFTR